MSAFDDPQRLYFFFDYISHNAYLAWTRMGELAARHALVLEPVPVLFAGLLQAHGQKGPAEVPAKLRWMAWNVIRKARLHGIPLAPPASHPFNPLLALRACLAVDGAPRIALVDRLFRAAWAESLPVYDEAVVRACADDCGLDGAAILAAAASAPVKEALKASTDAAIRRGVFGVPTMLLRDELFWGFDDLDMLDRFAGGRDPLGDRGAHNAWFEIRPTAQRRQR